MMYYCFVVVKKHVIIQTGLSFVILCKSNTVKDVTVRIYDAFQLQLYFMLFTNYL